MKQLMGSVREAVAQLRQGTLTAVELCEATLQRQAAVDKLHPFITCTTQLARSAAAASHKRYEEGRSLGALDGVPVAVKDNFCTRGIPTTCGSRMLHSYTPPYSATVVERLLAAGAILVGKTNLDEYAMGSGTIDSAFGPSKNIYRSGIPYNFQDQTTVPTEGLADGDWYVTGGSSGGSALAVASGSAFLALGSDTGGSVRNPASYCGVVGFKPSYGLVSRFGLVSLVNSMDVPGILGRRVDDMASLLAVVAGHDPRDSTSVPSELQSLQLPENPSLEGVVVGIPQEFHLPGLSAEMLSAWTNTAQLMEEAGAEVREVSLPHSRYTTACYSVLNPCEVASNFTRYTGVEYGHRQQESQSMEAMYALTRSAGFSEVVRSRILAGNYFLLRENKEKYFQQALKVRRLIWQDFVDVWSSGVHLLLTPTTLSPGIRHSQFSQVDNRSQVVIQDKLTQPANMAGVPALSLPVGLSSDGLPVSLQLMAPWGTDRQLLAAAKWMEQHTHFPRMELQTD